MERSVRYIRVNEMKPALCVRGKTWAYAIINDETCIRAVNISIKQHDLAPNVFKGLFPYPVALFEERIRAVGARKGLTRLALALLGLTEESEEPATLPPDEIAAPEPVARPRPAPEPAPAVRSTPKRADKPVPPTPAPKRPESAPVGLIAKLAAELKIAPQQLRLSLRLAGLRAPYENQEVRIRKVLKI